MTRGELAVRQAMACQEILEPVEAIAIDHEDGCEGDACSCGGTAWFKGLSMIVGVNADLATETFWLM